MSIIRDIVVTALERRDSDMLDNALTIVFPDQMTDRRMIIHEYEGSIPRLFGDGKRIELMLPKEMDSIMENAVVEAIENGTLFDDADHVNNVSTYVTMTKLPITAMSNEGIDEPKMMKHAIGAVVGGMNSEGRFGRDEQDIENGIHFAHDLVKHGDEDTMRDLVASYMDAKDKDTLPIEFRKSIKDLHKEVDDVKNAKAEDTISTSDIEDGLNVKKIKEGIDGVGDVDSDTTGSGMDTNNVEDVNECGTQCVEEDDDITKGEMQPGETPTTPTSESYTMEGFFKRPKKLKPIPRDVVAYISVEINAIRDSNDQAMLAGYTCSKLELVDFYITCIDTNDDRYIVPHTRQYLVQMQDDLNRLLTRILQIKPVNKAERIWKVNVTLPEGR